MFSVVPIVEFGRLKNKAKDWFLKELSYSLNFLRVRDLNYNEKNLDLEGHFQYHALKDSTGHLVASCGVYNGGRYPEGVFRIMNRVFVSYKYRDFPYQFIATKKLLPLQIKLIGCFPKILFCSRENITGHYFLKKWISILPNAEKWCVSDKLIQVVPHSYTKPCFQFIAYQILEQKFKWKVHFLNPESWNSLDQIPYNNRKNILDSFFLS